MRRLFSLVLLFGCETAEPQTDAGVVFDTGLPDAGEVFDSGTIDTGTTPDTGVSEVPLGWTEVGGMPEATGRWGAEMVYVPEERRLLMYGGTMYPSGGAVDGLWSYALDDDVWTAVDTTGDAPAPRYCHCLAYLPDHRQMLLVGGRDSTGPRDPEAFVFDLDTNVWTRIERAVPRGVIGCRAEWVPSLGRAIVSSGGSRSGFDLITWSYDPDEARFIDIPTTATPPGRSDAASALDPATDRIYIFGGVVRAMPPFEHRSDTWMFDGTDWTEIVGPGPSARRFPATAVDPSTGSWYVFGGTVEEADYDELWRFDFASQTWTELSIVDPPAARAFPASAWDPTTESMVLFGGLTQTMVSALSDGWRFHPE